MVAFAGEMTSRIESELLRPQEVAAELRVSLVSVRRWIREGSIDVVRTPGGHVAGIPIDALRSLRVPATPRHGHHRTDRRVAR